TGEAAALAEQAVDALNATALAIARSRSQVAGARSGSGFAEAVEQLARMARDQQGLNGAARGLLPMMGPSGQAVLEQLRAIAARQRALAQQLERLQAEGGSGAAGALAQEARELARQLDAGRLDQQTIQRQERLYRRLLDAGRTLSGSEPDESKERSSRPATGDSVHLPALLGLERVLPSLSRLPELLPAAQRAVAASPGNAALRAVLLRTYVALNEPDSARAVAQRWTAEQPRAEAPYREWAIALEDVHRFDEA